MTIYAQAAIPSYIAMSANEARYVSRFDASNQKTMTDIAYFTHKAPKLSTVDAFMRDYRSLSVVLESFGMKAQLNQTALIRQLLTQDPASPTSLARKSANPVFQRFATAIARWKPPPFNRAGNVAAITNALGQARLEAATDLQTPGVGTALYFTRTAAGVSGVNQLMSDPRLLSVMETVKNIPASFGQLDYPQQLAIIKKLVDIKKFSDSAYIKKISEQYIVATENNGASVADPNGAIALLSSTGSSYNILSTAFPTNGLASADPILSLFA